MQEASEGRYDDEKVDITGAYAEALVRLVSVRIDQPQIEHVLDDLLSVTQQAMERSVAISVTAIQEDGSYATAASTSRAAREVDAFEYDLDEGPCIDALKTGEEQHLDDVATDRRWPRFSERAAQVGFATVVGIPLRVGDRTIGALDVYALEPSGLEEDLDAARRLARPAAIVIANGSAYRRTHLITSELEEKLRGLALVNQAIGILMARKRCDTRAAKELLLATAEATGRELEDVAAAIVGHDEPGPLAQDRKAQHVDP